MNRPLFIFCCAIVLMVGSQTLQAQWTAADSIRLSNILSGKDTLRINPEFERSIREGGLLNLERKKGKLMEPEREQIAIELDFSLFNIKPERSLWKTAEEIMQLPPQVFWLYTPELGDVDQYGNKVYRVDEKFHAYLEPLRSMKKGKLQSLDFNDALSTVFSSHYRLIKQNRENAIAHKSYHKPLSPEMQARRQKYLEKHPEMEITDNSERIMSLESDSIRTEQADSLQIEMGIPSVYLIEGRYWQ